MQPELEAKQAEKSQTLLWLFCGMGSPSLHSFLPFAKLQAHIWLKLATVSIEEVIPRARCTA